MYHPVPKSVMTGICVVARVSMIRLHGSMTILLGLFALLSSSVVLVTADSTISTTSAPMQQGFPSDCSTKLFFSQHAGDVWNTPLCRMTTVPAFASSNVRNRCLDSCLSIRGGGASSWWQLPWRQKSASQIYRETLQDQVSLLEKQLRQTHEELQQLRQRYQNLASNSRQAKVRDLVQSKEEQQAEKQSRAQLQQRIDTLLQQVGRLEAMKEELEAMLEVQHQKVKELEAKLEQSQADRDDLQRQYQQQLKELETELLLKSQQQLDELRRLMEERMAEAVKQARAEMKQLSQRELQMTTDRLQREAEQAVQSERRKTEEAVEKEKAKMRKLVKTLLDREKKLGRSEQEEKVAKSKTTTTTKASGKPNHPAGSQTVRGPLKYD